MLVRLLSVPPFFLCAFSILDTSIAFLIPDVAAAPDTASNPSAAASASFSAGAPAANPNPNASQSQNANPEVAFSRVPRGQGIAYFPALSLSSGECVRANFGGTPLLYPFTELGYRPVELPPHRETALAGKLCEYLERIVLKLHAVRYADARPSPPLHY